MYRKDDWISKQYVEGLSKSKLLPTDFYYDDQGRVVMTESYHLRRGECCGNGCKNCPYEPNHTKGNTKSQTIYKK